MSLVEHIWCVAPLAALVVIAWGVLSLGRKR